MEPTHLSKTSCHSLVPYIQSARINIEIFFFFYCYHCFPTTTTNMVMRAVRFYGLVAPRNGPEAELEVADTKMLSDQGGWSLRSRVITLEGQCMLHVLKANQERPD